MKESPNSHKARIRAFIAKYPDRDITTDDLRKHFTEMSKDLIAVYTSQLAQEGSILRTAPRARFKWNPDYKTPEEKRALIESHIANGQSRVVLGEGWKPGEPSIKAGTDNTALAYVAQQFAEAVIDRMKATGFTRAEIAFVKRLADERYPLSEQQRIRFEGRA